MRIAVEQCAQIPRAAEGAACGVEEMGVMKIADARRLGPFAGGGGADLHEAELARGAARIGIEAALTPHHGFDKRGIQIVMLGGGADHRVLAARQSIALPPPQNAGVDHQYDQNDKPSPQLHGLVLGEERRGVEVC